MGAFKAGSAKWMQHDRSKWKETVCGDRLLHFFRLSHYPKPLAGFTFCLFAFLWPTSLQELLSALAESTPFLDIIFFVCQNHIHPDTNFLCLLHDLLSWPNRTFPYTPGETFLTPRARRALLTPNWVSLVTSLKHLNVCTDDGPHRGILKAVRRGEYSKKGDRCLADS